jgi:hypothetical protein
MLALPVRAPHELDLLVALQQWALAARLSVASPSASFAFMSVNSASFSLLVEPHFDNTLWCAHLQGAIVSCG